MPQLDKFTYFTQFFWSCLFFFTFYIFICNDGDGVLGISRILKLRNQLVSRRGNNDLRPRNDPNSLEDILRKGFKVILVYLVFIWFDIPVIAYCADEDEQTNSPEAGIGASSSIESVPPELGDGQEVSEVREANRTDPLGDDEVKQPLMVDHQRQMELERRLCFHFIGRHNEIETMAYKDLIEKQLLIEKKMEIALLNDGYSREIILANLNAIRGYLFYPNGTPLKESTLDNHLKQIGNDIRQNIPYARIQKAIQNFHLF